MDLNRSFRAGETVLKQRQQIMKDKEDDLALFLEMRRREKDRSELLLLQNSDDFDAPLGEKVGGSPVFNIGSNAPTRKTGADDFLNSDNDKNDYDWLLTPPGTPLFPSLEMELQRTVMSQLGTSKTRPTALTSRLANPQPEPVTRSNVAPKQPVLSLGLNSSSAGVRRPSSSGGPGSRPTTPNGRPTLSTSSKSTGASTSRSTSTTASKVSSVSASKAPTSTTASKITRSTTPTSRATLSASRSTGPPRSSTPTARSTARSSTPTVRPSIPASKSASRTQSPARRPTTVPSSPNISASSVKSPSSSSVSKSAPATRNPPPPRSSSPNIKPKPWKPSDMPGFSLDAPPNLRTSLPDRPISATRGRAGAPTLRSSSVEPISNGRVRRQSCSPSRGRSPNGIIHNTGSSVPAMNRLYAKANDNVSPVVIGNKMVERVVNMRKLAPPKQDDKQSPHSNLSGKSSSPESSGFGRTLSKKSLDMAIRHMDIRRTIPGNLRPLMTSIPASSMYSVRSGPGRSRTAGVSESPIAASSKTNSNASVNNAALCVGGNDVDYDISKGV